MEKTSHASDGRCHAEDSIPLRATMHIRSSVALSCSLSLSSRTSVMQDSQPLSHDEIVQRVARDLADSYDEELEMELEDHQALPDAPVTENSAEEKAYRRRYFTQLFRLQAELVKLQDWAVASREKIVIVFEGRD